MDTVSAQRLKPSKTCDECKARKVRCTQVPNSHVPTCQNCRKRGIQCHFSLKKKRASQARRSSRLSTSATNLIVDADPSPGVLPITTPPTSHADTVHFTPAEPTSLSPVGYEALYPPAGEEEIASRKLYVDYLLEDSSATPRRRNETSLFKADDHYVGSSGIAFFSARSIASISDHLGHRRFADFIEKLASSGPTHLDHDHRSSPSSVIFNERRSPIELPAGMAELYISAYFDNVHPIYPILDRQEFERRVTTPLLDELLRESPPFSALYHSVLALGSQYHGGGSFKPFSGTAWNIYQVSLGQLHQIILLKETLLNVQAITIMAIFAVNTSCVQISHLLTAEAARMAQSLGLGRAIYGNEDSSACQRTFWVVYILEKTLSFACSKPSILADSEISCPVPALQHTTPDRLNWVHIMCRFSRLISKVKDSLFSTSTTVASPNSIHSAINRFSVELDSWRQSIPRELRPGSPFPASGFQNGKTFAAVSLRLNFHYYSVVIALARLRLDLALRQSSPQVPQSREDLLRASHSIIELTRYIEIETYTPISILLSIPLSASFILFDFIIHHPSHTETKSNLALLGVAAGYFCLLDHTSKGALPTSHLSEILSIARDYVHDVDRGGHCGTTASSSISTAHQHQKPTTTGHLGFVSAPEASSDIQGGTLATSTNPEILNFSLDNMEFPLGDGGGIDLMDLFTTGYSQDIITFD